MRTPGSPELLEQRRTIAARMFQRGDRSADIALVLEVHVQTVRAWRREFDAGGMDALLRTPHPGPPCRLNDEQKQQLVGWLAQLPSEHGYDQALWTTTLIGRLIRERLGVTYHHDHVGVILHQLGFSHQKPMTRPRERDEAKIQQWKSVTFPAIAKRSRERHATMVFVDEAGYRMLPSVKKQWARRGQTPVLTHRCRHHEKVRVIGGISFPPHVQAGDSTPQTHLQFYPGGNVDQARVAAFVRQLVKQIPGNLTLIWDNLQAHRGKFVQRTLADHPQVEVYPLPAYAPDLNPIEGLWCHSKHHTLANAAATDLDQLTAHAKSAARTASKPHLLHACLRQTGLHHALYPDSAQ